MTKPQKMTFKGQKAQSPFQAMLDGQIFSLHLLQNPLLVTDLLGNFIFMNEATQRFLQHLSPEAPPQTIFDVFPFLNQAGWQILLPHLEANTPVSLSHPLKKDWEKVSIVAERFDYQCQPAILFVLSFAEDFPDLYRQLAQTEKNFHTLLYRSSHNLAGPLATLKGLIHLVQEQQNPRQESYTDLMKKTIQRMEKTLTDLQFISHIESKTKPERQKIQFERVWMRLRQKLAKFFDLSQGMIEWSPPLLPHYYTDEELLTAILEQLISNALQFRHATRKPHVQVRCTWQNKMLGIEVEDNGQGISQTQQSNLFQMFYRGSAQSTGNGLGLYSVKKAVQVLNGVVSLSSEEGVGTCVRITLPNLR